MGQRGLVLAQLLTRRSEVTQASEAEARAIGMTRATVVHPSS